jgi:Mg-chelatase subunit ChlD
VNDNLTMITIVLDRSGSMGAVRNATIAGFNEFIEAQKKGVGDAGVTLIQFDTGNPYEVVFDLKPVEKVPKLTTEQYVPRGGTPLHDALGHAVDSLGGMLASLPEQERPGTVIIVTITDGLENSSRKYSAARVAEMIKHQQETYNWQFVFLGANQDAILTGERLNIPASSSLTYNATPEGIRIAMSSTSSKINWLRAGFSKFIEYDNKDREKAQQK